MVADPEIGGDLGERTRVHHALAEVGHLTFAEIAESEEDQVGDDPAEHGVAEELEALVARLLRRRLGHPGTVAHRAPEQLPVAERVPEASLERVERLRNGRVRGRSRRHPAPS